MRRYSGAIFGAVLVAATSIACGGGANTTAGASPGAPKQIPITVIADLTGAYAIYGETFTQGVKVGIEQAKQAKLLNGSEFVLTVRDSASTAATATTMMSQAVQGDAVAILGLDTSPLALPAAPIAQQAGVPLLADSSAAGLIPIGQYVYTMANPYDHSAPLVASAVGKVTKNVSVIYANDNPVLSAYFTALSNALKAAGIQFTSIGAPIGSTDFAALVTRALSTSPGAVIIDSGGPMVPGLITAFRTAGFQGPLFGGPGSFASVTNAPPAANGFQYPQQWVPDVKNQQTTTFLSIYNKAYPNSVPLFTAIDGYDALQFLALGIQKGGASRAGALKGMQEVAKTGFAGPPGQITFAAPDYRAVKIDYVMAKIDNGTLKLAS